MSDPLQSKIDSILATLEGVREECASLDEDARIERLAASLTTALEGAPAQPELLDGLRGQLVQRARERDLEMRRAKERAESADGERRKAAELAARVERECAEKLSAAARVETEKQELEREVAELRESLEREKRRSAQIEKEREDLGTRLGEVESRLREAVEEQVRLSTVEEERETLRKRIDELEAAQASAAPPAAAAPPPLPQDQGLGAKLRDGLMRRADGERVMREELELSREDGDLFELMSELLVFAIELNNGVEMFKAELELGLAVDTVQLRTSLRRVVERLREALSGDQGALEQIRELLARNRRFLIVMNESYRHSITVGTKAVLAEIDPEVLLQEGSSQGFLKRSRYETAFGAFQEHHSFLNSMGSLDLIERFFMEPFKTEMRKAML